MRGSNVVVVVECIVVLNGSNVVVFFSPGAIAKIGILVLLIDLNYMYSSLKLLGI